MGTDPQTLDLPRKSQNYNTKITQANLTPKYGNMVSYASKWHPNYILSNLK